ncbi:unnamed protein product, partial [Phaeothamnion confervicola]
MARRGGIAVLPRLLHELANTTEDSGRTVPKSIIRRFADLADRVDPQLPAHEADAALVASLAFASEDPPDLLRYVQSEPAPKGGQGANQGAAIAAAAQVLKHLGPGPHATRNAPRIRDACWDIYSKNKSASARAAALKLLRVAVAIRPISLAPAGWPHDRGPAEVADALRRALGNAASKVESTVCGEMFKLM